MENQINLKIPQEVEEKLLVLCKRFGLTKSGVIKMLILEWISKYSHETLFQTQNKQSERGSE